MNQTQTQNIMEPEAEFILERARKISSYTNVSLSEALTAIYITNQNKMINVLENFKNESMF